MDDSLRTCPCCGSQVPARRLASHDLFRHYFMFVVIPYAVLMTAFALIFWQRSAN